MKWATVTHPKFGRHMEAARKWSLQTLKAKTATDFQRFIRAKAAAAPSGAGLCVLDGKPSMVWRSQGELLCVTCGSVGPWNANSFDAGHWLASRRNSILFEETNCHSQCKYDNRTGGAPEAYREFMLAAYGPEEMERLQQLKNNVSKKFTKEQLVLMRLSYRDQTKVFMDILKGGLR